MPKAGVVRDLVGHGVGYFAHEEPDVFNFTISEDSLENVTLEEGMVIAIEPMINMGTWRVRIAKNGYTFKTADGSLSAHFEHTVAVTRRGCEILTF
jgi:methionyl aminopeptidase